MTKCRQCSKPMNPVNAAIGPVCRKCCEDNHRKLSR